MGEALTFRFIETQKCKNPRVAGFVSLKLQHLAAFTSVPFKSITFKTLVAGAGFEPTTFGL